MKGCLGNHSTSDRARIFTALVLTGILSVGSGFTSIKSSNAAALAQSPETTNTVNKQNIRQNKLPRSIVNAVIQDASRRTGINRNQLRLTDYSQHNWRNGCLELPQPDEFCTQAIVPGWRFVISDGRQNWVYHTNNNGSSIRLATAQNPTTNPTTQLPQSVRNAVLQAASTKLQQQISQLKIIQAQPQNWNDGCLELGTAAEGCLRAIVPGWRVAVGAVAAVGQTLVYHTDETGSTIRLNENASQTTSQQLPQTVRNAVLRQASQVSGLPINTLNIVAYKQKKFARGCEQSTFPNPCDPVLVSGWEVFVKSNNRISPWVFFSDETGSQVDLVNRDRPNRNNGNSGKLTAVAIPQNELPPPLDRNVVFRQIASGGLTGATYETVLLDDGSLIRVKIGDANDSERRVRRVSLQQVQQFQQLLASSRFTQFKNLSYPAPIGAADYVTYTLTSVDGTVKYNNISQDQLPSDLRNVIKAWNRLRNNPISDSGTGNNTGDAVPIPANEIPLPLDKDVVFRQISSGGFAAITYETVLLKDGTLIRVRVGDANDSSRSVRRISPLHVRQFEEIIKRSRFGEYKNLSYPAPPGAADFITYTLTSTQATVRYNDASQKNLPQNLLQVVNAWNQIGNIAR
ncbi:MULTISPECIES: hypothetical protein [Calothrix]|uniref:Serine/threonine protein kinase n=2 Tax=Calothrix TaxID=1186 RepID=A0ABR8ADP3_9CYAN|nr:MULTISPECIES: hypothetical protein [Calothrix]MBD2198048.1 hypothetical protein [Calothrix parietina FACHB-288]MBD2226319.1 hypothetical protein [Calothrix anomala FACHB-343]